VAVDPGITVSDVDNTNLAGATVSITANFSSADGDTLSFTDTPNITGSYNPATGVLTLSGTASIADYRAALRSVTYVNTSDAPVTTTRTVSFVVNDGTSNSNTGTRNITLSAVNDAPVNGVPAAQTTPRNTAEVFSSANGSLISVSDVDAGAGAIQVQLVGTNGTVTLSGVGGLTFTAGDGTADATMTFSGTAANVNAALAGLRFTPTSNFTGTASLKIVSSDLGNTGSGGAKTDTDTITITVT
jgi:hypothetical protein